MRSSLLTTLFLFFPLSPFGIGADLWVPTNYPTIQAAVNAASSGDDVIVLPGTYFENVVIGSCQVTLRSSQGAAVTTIDGSQFTDPNAASVIRVAGLATSGTRIEGFTLTGGAGTLVPASGELVGGGICVESPSVTVVDCVITANSAVSTTGTAGHGGGVYAGGFSFTATGNTITDNLAKGTGDCFGGGICVAALNATITQNGFESNVAEGSYVFAHGGGGVGGGLGCDGATGTIDGNDFSENWAKVAASAYRSGWGGGIGSHGSTLLISNNVLEDNHCYGTGGGIAMDHGASSYGDILDNTVDGNEAQSAGGIHAGPALISGNSVTHNWTNWGHCGGISGGTGSQAQIVDNTISENAAYAGAGGVGNCNHVVGNVIRFNTANGNAGGVSLAGGGGPCRDNEVYGNQAQEGAGIDIGDNAYTSCMVTDNHVYANIAAVNGGGIRMSWGAATLVGNLVHDNYAGQRGGGLYLTRSGGRIENNCIRNNTAQIQGGGMYTYVSSPSVINDTFRNNTVTSGQGGELYVDWYYSPVTFTVANSIFWDDATPTSTEIFVTSGTLFEISYSDVCGGAASVSGTSIVWGPGMIAEDPLFAGPTDCHLTAPSPCIEAGSNAFVTEASDWEGDPRIAAGWPFLPFGVGARVDMGCDEFVFDRPLVGPLGTIFRRP